MYDDTVNDLDMFTSPKYTVKGPGSIGGKSGKSINDKYRGIDTSHAGILDLNTSSNSDPGKVACLVNSLIAGNSYNKTISS